MPAWGWFVVGVLVAGAVVLAVLLLMSRRRTAALRAQFGQEYDRTLSATGRRRDAEAELQDRQQRRSHFQIRGLSEAVRERHRQQWRALQAGFVDDPSGAVAGADRLIQLVMRDRGYPVEDFEQRADDLSVDHPDVVDNYRRGHRLATDSLGRTESSTEDLRQAMWHYRALFEELVGPEDSDMGNATQAGRSSRAGLPGQGGQPIQADRQDRVAQ
jgi:hypothetical protein